MKANSVKSLIFNWKRLALEVLKIPFYLGCITYSICANGQKAEVSLTASQRLSLSKIQSPTKRLVLYKKYIHKDSIRFLRESNKYWQRKSDSLNAILNGKAKKLEEKQRKILAKIKKRAGKTQSGFFTKARTDSLAARLKGDHKYSGRIDSLTRSGVGSLAKDTTGLLNEKLAGQTIPIEQEAGKLKGATNFSAPSVADPSNEIKGKLNSTVGQQVGNNDIIKNGKELKGQAGQYKNELNKYKQYGDMPIDSLSRLSTEKAQREAEEKLLSLNEMKDYQREMKQFKELNELQKKYQDQASQFRNPADAKTVARQKAEEAAFKYLGDNPTSLNQAQEKIDKLMKKYSSVPNSNDLSTAVKRTSLQGRPFRERLLIATNFQVINFTPFSIDFSPQVGYKINSRFVLGVGGLYRQTFKDSIPSLSPEVFGYKFFGSYDVVKSFFVYGEYDQNSPGVNVSEGKSERVWKPAAWAGVGRRFPVLKKIDMTVVAMYNFLYEHGDPIFPQPFVVRVGFQLSDVALLKKRPVIPKW